MSHNFTQTVKNQVKPILERRTIFPFWLPHTTVPACLSGLAFWGANENFHNSIGLSSTLTLIIGSIIGALFSSVSGSSFSYNRHRLKQQIAGALQDIQNRLDDESLALTDEQAQYVTEELLTALRISPLSYYSHLSTAFGAFTTMVTSFAYTSLWQFVFNESDNFFVVGAVLAPCLGILETYLAHEGQKQEKELRGILSAAERIQCFMEGCHSTPSDVTNSLTINID